MLDLNLIEVDVNACGTWLTFRCLCQGYLDETRTAYVPFLSTASCVWGHDIRLAAFDSREGGVL